MLLFNGQGLCKSFGTRDLFRDLSISIFEKDKIGLIGKNGSGKSTFLKILAGLEKADAGILSPRSGLKVGYLPQTCEVPDLPPIQILMDAMKEDLHTPDYEKERIAEMWLSKLGFSGQEPSGATLSGGWKKRLLLAKEMLQSPDLLLLDEPTNHLDLEGILWLEKFLQREAPTYVLVSHDRYFLNHATNRVIEIDAAYPKGMFAIDAPYGEFLTRKEAFLLGQLEQEKSMASAARRELDWLRSNAKARTTKSQSRIDSAHELLDNLSEIRRRNQQKRAKIDFVGSERETRKLLVGKNIGKSLGQKTLFQHLDFTLSPGSRIGLMGPNGSGKTTLLRMLAGEIEPDQGTLKRAQDLKIVYFDQHRNHLPDDISLREALSPTGDFILFHGQKIHVNGWCQRFLFSPDILDLPIGKLSGGERARIAIAHLMLQPADLLLLDEPTNDLDIPTLETLEESLLEFPGAVVLITHDRCMLDRVCSGLLALGDLECTEIFADYKQWEASCKKVGVSEPKKEVAIVEKSIKGKLSYAEKKEYDQIERKIAKSEEELKALTALFENPEIAQNSEKLAEVCKAVAVVETEIQRLYVRWEELEQKQSLD